MTDPLPAQCVAPALLWMRVDAPATAGASCFDPAALEAVINQCRDLLADCLGRLPSPCVLYSAQQTGFGPAECLLRLPSTDAEQAVEQLPAVFRSSLRQRADESRRDFVKQYNWQEQQLSGWDEQIIRCFRFRCGRVEMSAEDDPRAFAKMAGVIRSHMLLPHLIEDDPAADARPRCTRYGRFTRMGDPNLAPKLLERWWQQQAQSLPFLQPDERLSAPALFVRLAGTGSGRPTLGSAAAATDRARVFLEFQGPNPGRILRSAGSSTSAVTEQFAALLNLWQNRIPALLSQHSASLVPDADGRLILCTQPAAALALAAALGTLAAEFTPRADLGMVVAATGSGWIAVRRALDEACQVRSTGLEMRVLKTHPQVGRAQIPLRALNTLAQLVQAFQGSDDRPLSNRWAYRFRDLAQTMGDDTEISRSELKRTLDHAESICPDHRRLIEELMDQVLGHGGGCDDFATLVTTAVFLSRGGGS